jgi:hypothetical protein
MAPMRPLVALALSSAFLYGCGDGTSSSSGGGDGGDAAAKDAGVEGGGLGCPPVCTGDGGHPGDATDESSTCADLFAMIEQMQADLRACHPQMPNQCTGITNGPCCAVTVTPGTMTENFDQAVMAYKTQCMPDCGIICPMAPSNTCDPIDEAGTTGTCQ